MGSDQLVAIALRAREEAGATHLAGQVLYRRGLGRDFCFKYEDQNDIEADLRCSMACLGPVALF